MLFNPLRFIKISDVEKKVQKLKLQNPEADRKELCDLIIKERSILCALSGALTTLPAAFPVVGTLLTLLGGVAVDISLISYFMMRMVMELSIVNGRDLYRERMYKEVVMVFTSAAGAGAVNKIVSRVASSQMNNQVVLRLVQQALLSMGIKSTYRLAVRVVPLIGAAIAGGINYSICHKIGERADNYYRLERKEDLEGVIDIEGTPAD